MNPVEQPCAPSDYWRTYMSNAARSEPPSDAAWAFPVEWMSLNKRLNNNKKKKKNWCEPSRLYLPLQVPSLWSSSTRRTPSNCLCYPQTFSPRLPVRCPESQSPIGCCESPPSSGFSLLPTRRRGYPSDTVVLISCQTSTLVSWWAPMLAARKWRSSIRCRESWSPIGCRERLLVGRPNFFFICQADRNHPSDDRVLCPSRRLYGPSRPDTALSSD